MLLKDRRFHRIEPIGRRCGPNLVECCFAWTDIDSTLVQKTFKMQKIIIKFLDSSYRPTFARTKRTGFSPLCFWPTGCRCAELGTIHQFGRSSPIIVLLPYSLFLELDSMIFQIFDTFRNTTGNAAVIFCAVFLVSSTLVSTLPDNLMSPLSAALIHSPNSVHSIWTFKWASGKFPCRI